MILDDTVLARSRRRLLAATALVLLAATPAFAQTAPAPVETAEDEEAQLPNGRKRAAATLDTLTVSATKVDEAAIDQLAGVTFISTEELERIQAGLSSELFRTTPGVAASMNGDDPATAINIRGLQQFGRVVVTLDGARQDYWRVGHGSGSFYVEPELLKEVTVIRGPVSNAYGSGGIGGVVAFETKDAGDFLRSGERWALSEKLGYETNGEGFTTSTTGAFRFNENADVIGNFVWRDRSAYDDGDGDEVPWTGETVESGLVKGTFRPAEGHELKLGANIQSYDDFVTGSSGSPSATLSRYDAHTVNQTYTARYTYSLPDDNIFDFKADAYYNDTRTEQDQVWPSSAIGNSRYYDVSTTGFNVNNTSRISAFGLEHAFTYGGDYYYIEGGSDAAHFGAGEAQGYGAFLQWQGDYDDWLQFISAVRYDGYQLDGQARTTLEDVTVDGDRWSPRFTVGVTPFAGFQIYGGYSEGYRAPGLQDIFRGGGAHGSGDSYIPNFLLKPEIAKSWEAGVNLKYDGVFTEDDLFRAKINVFHTDVEDYIDVDLTGSIRQASNIGDARLEGVEIEGVYDIGWGFVNLTASFIDAEMTSGIYDGLTLNATPLDRVSATVGFRAFEERLTFGAQWLGVGESITYSRSTLAPTTNDGFELVNLFANWQINDNLKLDLAVENLFDEEYTDPQSAWSSSAITEQGKGQTFKIAVTGRIGG